MGEGLVAGTLVASVLTWLGVIIVLSTLGSVVITRLGITPLRGKDLI